MIISLYAQQKYIASKLTEGKFVNVKMAIYQLDCETCIALGIKHHSFSQNDLA